MKCVRGGFPVRNPEDAGLSDSGIGDLSLGDAVSGITVFAGFASAGYS